MTPAARVIFSRVRSMSTLAALVAVAVSLIAAAFGVSGTAPWQVWLAVAALAAGIPHGAVDHLVTVPSMKVGRMAVFVAGYLAVTGVAIAAILTWNVLGFIGVVVMSAVHFGIGDAAFLRQMADKASSRPRVPWGVYAFPAGFMPVVIPLTSTEADSALNLVNSSLRGWDQGLAGVLWGVTLVAGVVGVIWLAVGGQIRDAIDLVALALLALFTPPLVAFAVYFGLWHAQRHTARLVLEMPGALADAEESASRGFMRAVLPGIPALIGTLIVAVGLTWATGGNLSMNYLWITLVIIWALTVPHMALTWRLDRQALSSHQKTALQR